MQVFQLKDEWIKLGQLLKASGLVESGVDAKIVIQDEQVLVNGMTETRRGKKIFAGDIVEFENHQVKVV